MKQIKQAIGIFCLVSILFAGCSSKKSDDGWIKIPGLSFIYTKLEKLCDKKEEPLVITNAAGNTLIVEHKPEFKKIYITNFYSRKDTSFTETIVLSENQKFIKPDEAWIDKWYNQVLTQENLDKNQILTLLSI